MLRSIGVLAAALLLAAQARAAAVGYGGEEYQHRLVEEARAQNGLQLDPSPEGKRIERIVTVPFDVIHSDDWYPQFLNWFHVTTLPYVVERELLFKAGDRWSVEKVTETERNMRTYLFLSAAQIVACKGSDPDSVVALVVTKDLWSLRPNANFLIVGSQLETLQAEITEQNVAGRMKKATVDFNLDLATFSWGLQYQDPRLLGSELTMAERGDLIWNQSTGVLEGGVALFSLQQPLYTLDTPWAWIATAQYRKDINRLYSQDQIAYYASPTTGQLVPYIYDRHNLDLQFGVTRSMGHAVKNDFSAGYRGYVHQYSVPPPAPPVQPATLADFTSSVVPLSESAGMLYAMFHHYQATYRELLDIQSYAVSEDYRLGLDFSAEMRLANPVFGYSSSYFQPLLSATWTSYDADDLFSVSTAADIRYEPDLNPSSPWVNGSVTAGIRNVSPKLLFARLHTALKVGRRFNDYSHLLATLGGDTSLRGYPQAQFFGANYWVANAEARTAPIAVATVHLGLAAFFDMGSASNSLSGLSPHASVGGGLRIGLPQFNLEVLRLDFGVPLEAVGGTGPSYITAQYGQAF